MNTVAGLTIPGFFFSLLWIPLVGALVGFWMIYATIAAFVLIPVILGYQVLRA